MEDKIIGTIREEDCDVDSPIKDLVREKRSGEEKPQIIRKNDVFDRVRRRELFTYVDGQKAYLILIDRPGIKDDYVKTEADTTKKNNLRCLDIWCEVSRNWTFLKVQVMFLGL
jgi:hypothetical protein